MKNICNNTKYNIDIVRQIFKDKGYYLVDTEYINNKHRMTAIDSEGYKLYLNLKYILIYNKKILRFDTSNPHTIWNIKNVWIPNNAIELELLSEIYNGSTNNNKLTWFNKNTNETFDACWNSVQSGQRYSNDTKGIISSEKIRLSNEEYLNIIESFLIRTNQTDWALKNKIQDVKSTKEYIAYENSEGYIMKTSLQAMRNRNTKLNLFDGACPEESLHNMNLWVNKNTNYELKSGQTYTMLTTKYIFMCKIHGEFEYPLYNLGKNSGCRECYRENNVGENHSHWKGGITPLTEYLRHKLDDWKRDSILKYNSKCYITGKTNDLVIHHAYKSFKEIFNETLQIAKISTEGKIISEYTKSELDTLVDVCKNLHSQYGLGIPLNSEIHKDFHSIYGYGNNTLSQFNEFISKYGCPCIINLKIA